MNAIGASDGRSKLVVLAAVLAARCRGGSIPDMEIAKLSRTKLRDRYAVEVASART
jgi:hypothetical protein